MPESRYEVLALFTGAMTGASLFVMSTGALLPFLESAFHLGQTQLGWVLSVQMVGALAMTAVAGLLTDRFGDKAVVLWTGVFMAIALIAASLIPNFSWLLFWLLMYGLGYAAVTPSGSHAIIYFFKKEDRGVAMGVRQCGVPIAGVIGSVVLPAIALHFDYQWALAAAGVLTLLACAVASALYREPAELRGERASLQTMLAQMFVISRDIRLLLLSLTSVALICAQVAVMAFLTLTFIHGTGYALPTAVALFTISQAFAVAGRLSWGWLSDHWFGGSRALPLAAVAFLTAIIAFALSLIDASTPVWAAGVLAAAIGFCAEGWVGVAAIGFAEIGGEQHAGCALGVGLTWIFAAAFIAPPIFGALVDAYNFPFAWRSIALVEALGIFPAALAGFIISRAKALAS